MAGNGPVPWRGLGQSRGVSASEGAPSDSVFGASKTAPRSHLARPVGTDPSATAPSLATVAYRNTGERRKPTTSLPRLTIRSADRRGRKRGIFMRRARTVTVIGGILVVAIAAIGGSALARGTQGHDHGGSRGGHLWLLARAAGLNRDQIATAFQNDSNLKSGRTNVRTTHQALETCLLTGDACTTQISAYGSAVQALSQERMTVWASLFASAPNLKQASSVQTQLQQLGAQRRQIFQQVFGSSTTNG